MEQYTVQVDARQYPPREKHAVIFDTLDKLKSGETMGLINDHDPKPLYYQLMAEYEGKFDWEYLEQGPEVWKVLIKRK